MTFYEIIVLLTGVAGLITPLSVLYARLVKPIKQVLKDGEDNKVEIECLKDDLKKLESDIERRDTEAAENRTITIRSLVSILDILHKNGANGDTATTKKALIDHLAKRASGRK